MEGVRKDSERKEFVEKYLKYVKEGSGIEFYKNRIEDPSIIKESRVKNEMDNEQT